MKEKSLSHLLILYVLMLLFASCENPAIMIVESKQVEIPQITIEEVKIMMMKPIKVYEKYVSIGPKVYGLNGNKKELVTAEDTEGTLHPFNDFFVKDGTVFFNISVMEDGPEIIPESDPVAYVKVPVIYYFFQTGEEITADTESSFPQPPTSNPVEMGIAPWSIISGDYKGTPISTIKQVISENNNPAPAFMCIDGYHVIPSVGIWFSVSIDAVHAEKGLYYSALNSGRFRKVSEYGRIW